MGKVRNFFFDFGNVSFLGMAHFSFKMYDWLLKYTVFNQFMPTHHRAAVPTALHSAVTSMCCTSTASFQLKTGKNPTHLEHDVQQESTIWRNSGNDNRNQLNHWKSILSRSRHECVKVVGPVVIIQLLLGAVGVAAAVGGRVPFISRQSHRRSGRCRAGHPHRGRAPCHPEARAGPAMGAPSPVTPRCGAAGGGAPRGAPGSPATTLGQNGLTEEGAEQEAGPAGCKPPIHCWHLCRQNMSKAYSWSVISHLYGAALWILKQELCDETYQPIKTLWFHKHLPFSVVLHPTLLNY